ncbi:MAG: HEAT repeat domain-containing protein [Asgard group archaeon]|nr:HEAT repeat domain-containing protein [Asgard group archaeon]
MTKTTSYEERLISIEEKLKSINSDQRCEAIIELLDIPSEKSIQLLEEVLAKESYNGLKDVALIVLAKINTSEIFPTVKKIFYDYSEQKRFRARAIWILTLLEPTIPFDFMKEVLTDKDDEIVFWGIRTLLNYPNLTPYFDILNNLLLKNNYSLVRHQVAWLYGLRKVVENRKILEKKVIEDTNPLVRQNCAWALGRLVVFESATALSTAMQKENNSLARRQIAISLGVVVSSLEHQTIVLSEEKKAILDRAIKVLLKFLEEDSSTYVRRACAEALGNIQDNRILNKLSDLLSLDTNSFVRREIIYTLEKTGDPRALSILQKALKSHYPMIVEAARQAIKTLEKKT